MLLKFQSITGRLNISTLNECFFYNLENVPCQKTASS